MAALTLTFGCDDSLTAPEGNGQEQTGEEGTGGEDQPGEDDNPGGEEDNAPHALSAQSPITHRHSHGRQGLP